LPGRYLHRTTQTQNRHTKTSVPQVGFERMTLMFEREKTVHASDSAATVIGIFWMQRANKILLNKTILRSIS
jgi:hypothetical protein